MPDSVPLPASAKAEAQEALPSPGRLSVDLWAVLLAFLLATLVKLGLHISW